MNNRIKFFAVFFAGLFLGAALVIVFSNLHFRRHYSNRLESMSRLAKAREVLIAIQESGNTLTTARNESLHNYLEKIKNQSSQPMNDAWGAPFRISVVNQSFVVWSAGSDGRTGGGHSLGPVCDSWEDIGITNEGFLTWVSGTGPYLTSKRDPFLGNWKNPEPSHRTE